LGGDFFAPKAEGLPAAPWFFSFGAGLSLHSYRFACVAPVREPVRIFVCEASYKTLSTRQGESLTKQDSKLVHSRLPVEGGPHGFGQHVAQGQPE
jgi:hypothetical protein